ncbi:T9SS type A sorting domain-containing protein [Arcicella sp. DC2W]|uniref:T9SS type A sorting domain-containing protein n=1 Tax=Arcicella gelida TaxID=2984195 RepID=A0ABU5S1V7_9BACT|nr:T9SS type A sorting domain-containing protein [Arcicella sp. DC2W]MEA5402451.1 T9SS type A sorting domain-containing protein [Arcicella sp. DC2W]
MKPTLTLLTWGFFFSICQAQTIYFSQNFNTATTSSQTPFENASAPTIGQFNYITNALITPTGEKFLKFIGNNSICRATRSTEFSPIPPTLYVQFSVRASSIGAENPDAVEFYFGNGANFDNTTTAPITPVMSIKFGVNTPSSLIIQGSSQVATQFLTVTLFINNDNRSMTYNDGTRSGTVDAKKYDLYVGTSLISNDLSLNNTLGNLTQFKILTKSIIGSPTLDFDNFIIKNDFVVLPIELIFFKAQHSGNQRVALTWATATEINSDFFVVERSRNAIDYTEISKINAAGSSSKTVNYQFVDENPLFGTNYYRLKQVDKDKKEQIFRPQSVIISDENIPFGVFPNPTNASEFYVKVEDVNEATLSFFDSRGSTINFEKINVTQTSIKIIPSSILPEGTYFLKVKTLGDIKEHKLIIAK